MKINLIIYIFIMIGLYNFISVYAQEGFSSDFTGLEDVISNAKVIADDIALLNETEIKVYPLNDLSNKDIIATFNILNIENITKVLLNIPIDDIKEIQNKLSEDEFNNILNRVSIENQTQIRERIDNN